VWGGPPRPRRYRALRPEPHPAKTKKPNQRLGFYGPKTDEEKAR
jgi:hypothetical protein